MLTELETIVLCYWPIVLAICVKTDGVILS